VRGCCEHSIVDRDERELNRCDRSCWLGERGDARRVSALLLQNQPVVAGDHQPILRAGVLNPHDALTREKFRGLDEPRFLRRRWEGRDVVWNAGNGFGS
jgi:hypothetical protein